MNTTIPFPGTFNGSEGTTSNMPPRSKPQYTVEDIGDSPAMGAAYAKTMEPTIKSEKLVLYWLIFLSLVAATVDFALIYEILKQRMSDEFGIVNSSKQILIAIGSLATILGFFAIGRWWHNETNPALGKAGAIFLYSAIVTFLAVSLFSSYGADLSQFLGSTTSTWGGDSGAPTTQTLQWIKIALLIVIAIVMTSPGLAFTWLERMVEKKYALIQELSQSVRAAKIPVEAFDTAKTENEAAIKKAENKQAIHDAWSDPTFRDNVKVAAKMKVLADKSAAIQAEIDALPGNIRLLTKDKQATVLARKAVLEAELASLKTLKVK